MEFPRDSTLTEPPARSSPDALPAAPMSGTPPVDAATVATGFGTPDIPAETLVYFTPIGEFIHSADSKAATVLTVLGIMFTLLARFGAWLDDAVRGDSRLLTGVTVALIAGFAGAAFGAVVQAFRTIAPRFPKMPSSLAFFGDIAVLSSEQYVSRLTSLSPAQALAERLQYNHNGATIILLKTAQMRWALRYFEIAAVCWLALAGILLCGKLLP